MFARFGIAALFVVAMVAPALADSCSDPIPPEVTVNGSTATMQQMSDAIKDFKNFQAASDDYQNCLLADLKQQEQAAANAKDPKPLDPSIAAGVNAKIAANQNEKQKVGQELNTQILAYKKAHPSK